MIQGDKSPCSLDYHPLKRMANPRSRFFGFKIGKNFTYESISPKNQSKFDYKNRHLLEKISVIKRAAKRHFRVHGYFTKQAWDVVVEYLTG
jgi:hypothetical protein